MTATSTPEIQALARQARDKALRDGDKKLFFSHNRRLSMVTTRAMEKEILYSIDHPHLAEAIWEGWGGGKIAEKILHLITNQPSDVIQAIVMSEGEFVEVREFDSEDELNAFEEGFTLSAKLYGAGSVAVFTHEHWDDMNEAEQAIMREHIGEPGSTGDAT